MKADNRSGFHYKRSENTSSKVLGMHRKVDTKILNKLFSDSWPTDYNKIFQISRGCGLRVEGVVGRGVVG